MANVITEDKSPAGQKPGQSKSGQKSSQSKSGQSKPGQESPGQEQGGGGDEEDPGIGRGRWCVCFRLHRPGSIVDA